MFLISECGEDIVLGGTTLEKNITSVGFPSNYVDDLHCVWNIATDSDHTLQVCVRNT